MTNTRMDCKVYIGDLGNNAREADVQEAFSYFGRIRAVWVARRPPGFAFVEFESPRDAEDAVRGLDGRILCGRRIKVQLSHGRSRWPGGRPPEYLLKRPAPTSVRSPPRRSAEDAYGRMSRRDSPPRRKRSTTRSRSRDRTKWDRGRSATRSRTRSRTRSVSISSRSKDRNTRSSSSGSHKSRTPSPQNRGSTSSRNGLEAKKTKSPTRSKSTERRDKERKGKSESRESKRKKSKPKEEEEKRKRREKKRSGSRSTRSRSKELRKILKDNELEKKAAAASNTNKEKVEETLNENGHK